MPQYLEKDHFRKAIAFKPRNTPSPYRSLGHSLPLKLDCKVPASIPGFSWSVVLVNYSFPSPVNQWVFAPPEIVGSFWGLNPDFTASGSRCVVVATHSSHLATACQNRNQAFLIWAARERPLHRRLHCRSSSMKPTRYRRQWARRRTRGSDSCVSRWLTGQSVKMAFPGAPASLAGSSDVIPTRLKGKLRRERSDFWRSNQKMTTAQTTTTIVV